jgi:steroid 5-alpha reductase family enzyme
MTGPLVLAAGALALWLLSLRLRDASIVDIAWAPAFAAMAWLATPWPPTGRGMAVLALASLWGVRLGLHIALRHNGEDRRYAAMRAKHGARWWWWSLLQVFALQAVLVWAISWPLRAAVAAPAPWCALDGIGVTLAAGGLLFEAVADWQLRRFRADPGNRGRVMDRGLWRWSRHPNYFGDALMWWGFFVVALAATGAWWLALSPIAMTVLLLRVSGVTLMEEDIGDRRPDYADYIRRTSAFVPWPPTSTPPR